MCHVKISVVLATYNGEKYLAEQLQSIYSQTIPPFEVIASDDCSSDSTVAILQSFVVSHRLHLIENAQRLGYNRNFERALMAAQGEYIAIADQDDMWYADKLERSLTAILSMPPKEPNLVTAVVADCDPSGKVYHNRKLKADICDYYDLVPDTYMQGATQLLNRELLHIVLPFPNEIFAKKITYDLYIASVALVVGNRYVLSQPVMKYRHHFENAAANRHTGKVRQFLQQMWKPISYNAISDRYISKYLFPVYKYIGAKYEIRHESFIRKLLQIPQRYVTIWTISEWSLAKRIRVFSCSIALDWRSRWPCCRRETVQ